MPPSDVEHLLSYIYPHPKEEEECAKSHENGGNDGDEDLFDDLSCELG